MYTSFFGFTCKPFQLTPDPEFLFLSRVHKRALTYLNYGIGENFGFILVTGEIGTGKTTIIRTLLKQIPQEIRIARINNTKVTSEQLISMINEDFGIDTKGKDKTQMLSELTDFLIHLYGTRERAVLIIDEAQNLSPDLLEEIRLLSNLETDKSKLLQIVLIGQPELDVTLSRAELEQLRQRIAFRTHISPLSREETEAYIRHRLKVAGNEDGVSFDEGVMDAIYDFSQGTPRLINVLCEFSLLSVFVDEKREIDLSLIREVISDLAYERPGTRASSSTDKTPGEQDILKKMKDTVMRFHARLRNLEAAVFEMQSGTDFRNELKKQLTVVGAELQKKEDELLKREYELLEKEEFLKKKEESIRETYEQNVRRLPS